jgi:predicted GNAT family N-acyltransferase
MWFPTPVLSSIVSNRSDWGQKHFSAWKQNHFLFCYLFLVSVSKGNVVPDIGLVVATQVRRGNVVPCRGLVIATSLI